MEKRNPSRCIILFVKAPVLGAVKTRLAKGLGARAALMLYRAFVADILVLLGRMDLPLRIFYYPESQSELMEEWLGAGVSLHAQHGDNLGERMHDAFCRTAAEGFDRILLVGSDVPELDEQVIGRAFSELETHPAVIGPACDGGYYLIGFRKKAIFREAFAGIKWGTPEVLQKTLQQFQLNKKHAALAPTLKDIDTCEDWQDLAARLKHGSASVYGLQHTRAVFGEMEIPVKGQGVSAKVDDT